MEDKFKAVGAVITDRLSEEDQNKLSEKAGEYEAAITQHPSAGHWCEQIAQITDWAGDNLPVALLTSLTDHLIATWTPVQGESTEITLLRRTHHELHLWAIKCGYPLQFHPPPD